MGKEQLFQQMVLGKMDIHSKRMKMDSNHTSYTKANSKWIKDLNVNS